MVDLLVTKGMNFQKAGKEGRTPLMNAAFKGKCEIVQYLLNKGANPNIKDENCFTPLMWAVTGGHISCVQLILPLDSLWVSNGKYKRDLLNYARKSKQQVLSALLNATKSK